jgi:uncharacterized membrane protein
MIDSPLLLVHICAATVGLLSGFLTMVLRKGSGLHKAAGNIFFVAMLLMSSSAVYIATFLHPIRINVVVGLLTVYLVSTGWWAARRKDGPTGMFDAGALLFVAMVGILGVASGFEAANSAIGMLDGIPAALYFVFGIIGLLHAAGDVRMLVRRSLSGGQRIARHLWRMSFALLIATISLYPGQAKLFPMWFRETRLMFVPHVLLLGAIAFGLVRVRTPRRAQRVVVDMEYEEAA